MSNDDTNKVHIEAAGIATNNTLKCDSNMANVVNDVHVHGKKVNTPSTS